MPFRILRVTSCSSGKTCPAIGQPRPGSYVIVGKITDPGPLGVGEGETAIEVPAELLDRRELWRAAE